jgi:hypothetical protein
MKKREPNQPAQPTKLIRGEYDGEFKQQAFSGTGTARSSSRLIAERGGQMS